LHFRDGFVTQVPRRRPPAGPLHSSQAAGVALRGRPFQPAAAGTK
jgi:hypothetical protein